MAVTLPNLNPDRDVLRRFGPVALIGFGLLGGLILWRGGLFGLSLGAPVGYALIGLGLLCLVLGVVAPHINRYIYVGMMILTFPIALVLSFTLLSLIFFGLITPLGLFFRAIGRDTMHRRFDKAAKTYWVKRERARTPASYFSQY